MPLAVTVPLSHEISNLNTCVDRVFQNHPHSPIFATLLQKCDTINVLGNNISTHLIGSFVLWGI